MTILTSAPLLGASVRLSGAATRTAERAAEALRGRTSAATTTNEVFPVVAVAVVAAIALIAIIGAAAAWIFYCQSTFGGRYWPAVGVPSKSGAFYYLACRK